MNDIVKKKRSNFKHFENNFQGISGFPGESECLKLGIFSRELEDIIKKIEEDTAAAMGLPLHSIPSYSSKIEVEIRDAIIRSKRWTL